MWTGIDISNSAIKVIQVERSLNGKFSVVGAARLKYQLPDDEAGHHQVISGVLSHIFNHTGLMPDNCVVGVTGKEINLRVTHIPPTPDKSRLRKMMEYEVMQIAGKSSENVYSDYKQLNLVARPYPEIPVMVGLAKNSYIDDQLKPLKERGANLRDICPRVIGLSNALQASKMVKPAETALLVDIGPENNEIIIHQGDHLIFARNLSGGADQIASLIESAVSFAKTQLKLDSLAVDLFLISGEVDKELPAKLTSVFNKPVEIFNPFKGMGIGKLKPETRERISADMTIAAGLALSGYLAQNTRISFLPPDIKKRIKLYQLYLPLIAAGVLFVIGIALLAVNSWREAEHAKTAFTKVENQKKAIELQTAQFKKMLEKKASIQSQYDKLGQVSGRGVFFYEVVSLLKQLPPEAWVKELTFDMAQVPPTNPKDKEIKTAKNMVIRGYLEDDSQATLEGLKSFVASLNHTVLGIKSDLTKLAKADPEFQQGKMEFEITIK
jgi:Tfp pilus assembly PilM family ATPase